MKISKWYHTADMQPPKSGYYLSSRGWGMGGKADGDHDHGYVYFDKKKNEWRDYESEYSGHYAIVYYWTDATPDEWVDSDPPVSQRKSATNTMGAAEKTAWEQVEAALKNYETIKALSQCTT